MPDPNPPTPEPLPPSIRQLQGELAEARKAQADGAAWAKAEIERLTKEIAELRKPKEEPAPAPEAGAKPASYWSKFWSLGRKS